MTELSFKGKEFVYNHHLSVPFHPLVPHPEKGIGDVALDGNLIIQGDNLKALKALLPIYAGKVDCIFIDPPYNTGNEGWSYNDNVNAPMIKEWLESNPIGIEDGLRHDKWCAMMWPRIRLLYDLLAEDGSFWVTLDDNEAHRAKLMFDEIFGEENFVANIVWQKKYTVSNDAKYFSESHDHLFCYAKSKEIWRPNRLGRTDEMNARYTNPDGHKKGPWKSTPLYAKRAGSEAEKAFKYTFKNGVEWQAPTGTSPRFPREVLDELDAGDEIWFGKEGDAEPSRKTFLEELPDLGPPAATIWTHGEAGNNHEARETIKAMFRDVTFDTPKPIKLLKRIVSVATDSSSVILDSFAGSGTTAHAILEANKLDGGNRSFILVEMEEYAQQLTAERVKRAIQGYQYSGTQKTELHREKLSWAKIQKSDKILDSVEKIENLHGHEYDRISKSVKDNELLVIGEKNIEEYAEGLGGHFTYCTLGEAIAMDEILTGENLPSYDQLGGLLFHMATNRTLDTGKIEPNANYLGESVHRHVWLIYRADLDWLKSPDAALTLSFARKITVDRTDKPHLVFAPARFVSQKLLNEEKLQVEFAPLPFALYRVERD
ncbi:MAG: site-specific DNA-methyltransferase [Pseudomonadota bacterium]